MLAQGRRSILRRQVIGRRSTLDDMSGVFTSTTERTAWNIAARHLARKARAQLVKLATAMALTLSAISVPVAVLLAASPL